MRAIVLACLLSSSLARAHTLWLEPRATKVPGEVHLRLQVGDHLRSPEPVSIGGRGSYRRALLVGPEGTEDVLSRLILQGQPVLSLEKLAKDATYLVALDSNERSSVLPAGNFASYLLEERLIDILARRAEEGTEDAPGRERYVRCVKALIGRAMGREPLVTRAVGQELEIVPLEDPRTFKPGTLMRFRVLLRGKPLANRSVTSARRNGEAFEVRRVRTGEDGVVAFPRSGKGDWLIALVHMEKDTMPGFEWRSIWSSFFFTLEE